MKKIKKHKFYIITASTIITIAIIAYTLLSYNTRERLKEIEINLNSIADLKAAQVSDWLNERLDDARTIQNSPNYRTVNTFLQTPKNRALEKEIKDWLYSIKNQFEYEDIWLLDKNYNVSLSLNGGAISSLMPNTLQQLISSKEVYFSDLQHHESGDSLYFEIIVPLLNEYDDVYSFLVFKKSPRDKLFPLISYWPISNNSAESILFRIENDRVVFLNDLKYKDSVPLNFSIPLNDTNFWGSKDLNDYSGLIDSRDYRGENVIALIKKIPDSNWYLKIKINKAEILAPIRQETTTYILMLLLVAALIILFAYQLWKMKNITHLEKMLELEEEKKKLQKLYEQITQNANDSIFLLNETLKIIEANDISLKTYGYSRDEFTQLTAVDIRAEADADKIASQYNLSKKQNGIIFNTTHIKKNGETFPVEVSLSSFSAENANHYISIVRDISERIEAEKKIDNLNKLYSVLSQINSMIVRERNEKLLFSRACNIISKYGNYGIVAIVSKTDEGKIEVYSAGCICDVCQKTFHNEAEKFSPLFMSNYNDGYIYSQGLTPGTYIGPGRQDLVAEGFKNALYIPIFKAAQITGTLIILTKDSHSFDDVVIELFSELAGDISYAVTSIEQAKLKSEGELIIKENERKLSTIVQNMPGVVYRCKNDKNWTMEFISPNIIQLAGWTPEDLINNNVISFNDLIYPDDRERVWQEVQEKIVERKTYNLRYRIVHIDGAIINVSENAQPVINSSGKLEAIEGIIFDITELEKTKTNLEQTEGRYKNLIENSAMGIAMADVSGKIIVANKVITRLLDKDLGKVIGTNINQLNVTDSLKVIISDRFGEVIKSKKIDEYENEITLPRLGKVILSSTYAPVFDSKKELIGVQLIVRDITTERAAEENIRKLSQSVEQNPISLFITNLNGEIEYANPALVKQTGYRLEEMIGKNPRLFQSGLMEKHFYTNLWNTIKLGNVFESEILNKKKTGELYWEKAIIAPIKDKKGNITNYVALKEDITQKKIMEDELKLQRNKAEEMNRVKTNFFYNMSHELRTPMVGILGYIELLLAEEEINEKHKEMLKVVFSSSLRLHETLNSILNLSRIEFAETRINCSLINAIGIFKECTNLFQIAVKDKKVQIKIENEEDEFMFVTDENLFSKIITNLVSNAVKYTTNGVISLQIKKENSNIIIEVKDTGIGFDEKHISIVFEPFRQVSEGLSRDYEGTGLGLSIVKSYVELLGGTISIKSKVNLGTKVIISLPDKSNEIETIDNGQNLATNKFKDSVHTKSGKLILLVEDDAVNARFTKHLLSDQIIEIVSSGNEAILKSKKKKYDLILMDIGLKGSIDGVDTSRQIKMDSLNSATPIIALTAYAMVGDKEKILKAGLDDYLSKPFTSDDLYKMVDKYISE